MWVMQCVEKSCVGKERSRGWVVANFERFLNLIVENLAFYSFFFFFFVRRRESFPVSCVSRNVGCKSLSVRTFGHDVCTGFYVFNLLFSVSYTPIRLRPHEGQIWHRKKVSHGCRWAFVKLLCWLNFANCILIETVYCEKMWPSNWLDLTFYCIQNLRTWYYNLLVGDVDFFIDFSGDFISISTVSSIPVSSFFLSTWIFYPSLTRLSLWNWWGRYVQCTFDWCYKLSIGYWPRFSYTWCVLTRARQEIVGLGKCRKFGYACARASLLIVDVSLSLLGPLPGRHNTVFASTAASFTFS